MFRNAYHAYIISFKSSNRTPYGSDSMSIISHSLKLLSIFGNLFRMNSSLRKIFHQRIREEKNSNAQISLRLWGSVPFSRLRLRAYFSSWKRDRKHFFNFVLTFWSCSEVSSFEPWEDETNPFQTQIKGELSA